MLGVFGIFLRLYMLNLAKKYSYLVTCVGHTRIFCSIHDVINAGPTVNDNFITLRCSCRLDRLRRRTKLAHRSTGEGLGKLINGAAHSAACSTG